MLIRSRSALGLKYVADHARRTSSHGFSDGATIPLRNATPAPVEFDEVLEHLRQAARARPRRATCSSSATGSRAAGGGLNEAIAAFNPLLRNLVPVMRNLADPRTRPARVLPRPGARGAHRGAPVGEQQAALFRNLDTTFSALADVARPTSSDSISGGPPALDDGDPRPARASGPSWPTRRGSSPSCAPGVARSAPGAALPGRRLHDRHAGAAPLGGAQPPPAAAAARARRTSPRTRWCPSASPTSCAPSRC